MLENIYFALENQIFNKIKGLRICSPYQDSGLMAILFMDTMECKPSNMSTPLYPFEDTLMTILFLQRKRRQHNKNLNH